MSKRKLSTIVKGVMMTAILSISVGLAFAEEARPLAKQNNAKKLTEERRPLTPQHAAKKHMVSKQQDQRVTNEKRKSAAEALKAERVRLHKAKQADKLGRQ